MNENSKRGKSNVSSSSVDNLHNESSSDGKKKSPKENGVKF